LWRFISGFMLIVAFYFWIYADCGVLFLYFSLLGLFGAFLFLMPNLRTLLPHMSMEDNTEHYKTQTAFDKNQFPLRMSLILLPNL